MEKWEIRPKFAWVITSGTPTSMQNFITIRLPPFVPQICENAHQVTRLVFFLVLPTANSQDPYTDFHDQSVKWRGFAQGCAFWGFPKTKLYISTPFSPKNRKFWATFRRDLKKFCVKKALTMGMLPCELPFKYGVIDDPLFTGHVTQPNFGPKTG